MKQIHEFIISVGWIWVIGAIFYALGFGTAVVLMAGKWEDGTLREINLKPEDIL